MRPVVDYCHMRLLPLPPAVSAHGQIPGLLYLTVAELGAQFHRRARGLWNNPTSESSPSKPVWPLIDYCHIWLLSLLQAVGAHCLMPGLLNLTATEWGQESVMPDAHVTGRREACGMLLQLKTV